MRLGEILRDHRHRLHLRVREIAERLDVSEQAVRSWESGTRRPHADHLVALARVYGQGSQQLGEWARLAAGLEIA